MTGMNLARQRTKLGPIVVQKTIIKGSRTLYLKLYDVDGTLVLMREWSPTIPSAAELAVMSHDYLFPILASARQTGGVA